MMIVVMKMTILMVMMIKMTTSKTDPSGYQSEGLVNKLDGTKSTKVHSARGLTTSGANQASNKPSEAARSWNLQGGLVGSRF